MSQNRRILLSGHQEVPIVVQTVPEVAKTAVRTASDKKLICILRFEG